MGWPRHSVNMSLNADAQLQPPARLEPCIPTGRLRWLRQTRRRAVEGFEAQESAQLADWHTSARPQMSLTLRPNSAARTQSCKTSQRVRGEICGQDRQVQPVWVVVVVVVVCGGGGGGGEGGGRWLSLCTYAQAHDPLLHSPA